MNMNELTQSEKDAMIETILQKGLQKPMSMGTYLYELFQTLGFRFVFWDTGRMLVLSAIALVLLLLFQSILPSEYKHTTLFGCSPLLFVLIMSFAETIEYSNKLYELKMTCKYTIRQITAFRILCFSIIGIIFSAGITVYQSENTNELFHLLPLSFSAFFLCSFISLFFIRRFTGKWVYAVATILWIMVATTPAFIFAERWEQFLSGIPVLITIVVAIFSAVLSLNEMKNLIITNKKEGVYAFG